MTDADKIPKPLPDVAFDDLGQERRISERTAKILAYAPAILEAKTRGATWKKLATRLEQAGIKVAPDYLRALMERHRDEIKAIQKGSRKALPTIAVKRETTPAILGTNKPPTSPKQTESTHAAERNANRPT